MKILWKPSQWNSMIPECFNCGNVGAHQDLIRKQFKISVGHTMGGHNTPSSIWNKQF